MVVEISGICGQFFHTLQFVHRTAIYMYMYFISRNSNTSRGHQCILRPKYFPITSVDREKSEKHIYFMAFALKGTVLKIVKEKVISTCGSGNVSKSELATELYSHASVCL